MSINVGGIIARAAIMSAGYVGVGYLVREHGQRRQSTIEDRIGNALFKGTLYGTIGGAGGAAAGAVVGAFFRPLGPGRGAVAGAMIGNAIGGIGGAIDGVAHTGQ